MYSYENYDKVKAALEKRRLDAIASADSKNEFLRDLSDEIREIDKELSSTGMLLFRTACAGEDITPIKERNQALIAKRKAIIKSLGYPEDYTDVHYFCPKCSDTGYLNGGQICSCFRAALIKETISSSGMGNIIEKQTFENFNLDWYKDDPEAYERMKAIEARAKKYVKNFSKRKGNLLLIGNTGTGKTHISTAIAREIIHMGYDVIYDSVTNIVSDFEDDKFGRSYDRREAKSDKYLECDLLIIDDLGTEFTTQFTVSCLYNLLNTRHNRGLATIISTNLSGEDLRAKYEDRIYSRIAGNYDALPFLGKDHRIG